VGSGITGSPLPVRFIARCSVSFHQTADIPLHWLWAAMCRFCCKSLFAPLTANFSSCRCGFRVNMWGTSSPGDKLTGDLANEPDATSISDRGLFCLLAGNLSPGVFRLLQQNLPRAGLSRCSKLSKKSATPAARSSRGKKGCFVNDASLSHCGKHL
jgi:hypothetical protein